ncbi:unnamed protein product [Didymodactylos carnosus]|uniref:Uncharacterized protein n=1 Tax=Didymodactylos carnosus TaxID=1234261 RepID=A0A814BIG0_9BILA|nr:unnamed protein product [Didymodactylos carnosus]CAF3707906.1 unnamed protein product [Didymodactylos carnosus]
MTARQSEYFNVFLAITNGRYALIGVDIRDSMTLNTLLHSVHVNDLKPTLCISEVVLTYMGMRSCNRVIQWIQEVFQECILCTYEQVIPDDGFGQVMVGHFSKLGSPLKCIHTYPSAESHVERYTQLGFDLSICINMHSFNLYHLPSTEHSRISSLELFDETEEWQSKCAHYILLFGIRSSTANKWLEIISDDCQKHIVHALKTNLTSTTLARKLDHPTVLTFEPYKLTSNGKYAQRFGHQSLLIDRDIWTIGGFGAIDGRHRRLKTIELLNIDNGITQRLDNHKLDECVFHTCHIYPATRQILCFYGRTNPRLLNSCIKFDIDSSLTSPLSNENSVESVGRWRHCSCYVEETDIIVIFGGKLSVTQSTNETICFTRDGKMIRQEFSSSQNSVPSARHSSRMCSYKHYAVLSGGLLENELPTNEIWLFDTKQMQWTLFQTDLSTIVPRYSHSAHIIGDMMLLLGGMNAHRRYPPGLCKINLCDGNVIEYEIPVSTGIHYSLTHYP